jgi:hypothetical protein
MKRENTNLEQALVMYRETVSPSQDNLHVILSQIPEQLEQKRGRVIRSPYIFLLASQCVSLCMLLLVVYPTYVAKRNSPDFYFYAIDTQVDSYEAALDTTTDDDSLLN